MLKLYRKSVLKDKGGKLPNVVVTGCAGSVGRMIDSVWKTVFEFDLVGVDRDERIQKNMPWTSIFLKTKFRQMDTIFDQSRFEHLLENTHKVTRIVHLASIPRADANADLQLAKQYNVVAAQKLVESLKRSTDIEKIHVIFASCMSVYGDRTTNPGISVADKPNPNKFDYFAQTKLEAEQVIRESGINHTIMRFAPVCDPLNWWVTMPPNFFEFELDQKIEWITARDSARALKAAVFTCPQLKGRTLNIGGGSKLTLRHRDFMLEIMKSRGVELKAPIDLDPLAFANDQLYGGQFTDSDDSNLILGYRMQPIDTAYLRQLYRYPFPLRMLNSRLNPQTVMKAQFAGNSHVYVANVEKDTAFLQTCFDAGKMLPREEVEKKLNDEVETEKEDQAVMKRQLANFEKKAKLDFEEAKKQRNIRDAIERKWRKRREALILLGQDPNQINLDDVDKLEEEEKLKGDEKALEEKYKYEKKEEEELTEEQKRIIKEDEEDKKFDGRYKDLGI